MAIMLDFDCKFVESLFGLMQTFDDKSSEKGLDVNERGASELPGDPGNDVTPMMLVDELVSYK